MMYESLLEKAITAKYNSHVKVTVNRWSIITYTNYIPIGKCLHM